MSKSHQTYETYGPGDPYGAVPDPYSAPTVAYGVPVAPVPPPSPAPPSPASPPSPSARSSSRAPGSSSSPTSRSAAAAAPYADTYRPAYEAGAHVPAPAPPPPGPAPAPESAFAPTLAAVPAVGAARGGSSGYGTALGTPSAPAHDARHAPSWEDAPPEWEGLPPARDAGFAPHGSASAPASADAPTLLFAPPSASSSAPFPEPAPTLVAVPVPDLDRDGATGPASGADGSPGAGGARTGADGRAARRRKARGAERADGQVRRLLPRALVVAFLAGGTTAFVAEDKAVELTVDGAPRTLHTFADDVTELLADQGVEVGAHDVVLPAPGTELEDGAEITVLHGRPVRLTIDGERRVVWTTARTVEEALRQWGVRVEGAHLSAARTLEIGREGLALDVRTERAVTVLADGRSRTVRTNAATVAEVVEEAGVTLRGEDTTSVPPDSFPRDGQTVTVLRVTGTRETYEEAIPFRVRRVEDPTLLKGTEVVDQAGREGLRRITYTVRIVNGVRERPRMLDTRVVREPRTQVVRVGTRARPTSVRGADHLDWQALAACESGGRPHAVDPSGTYGGLYQFDVRTWQSLGGTGRPQDASPEEQTYRAKKLYVQRGAGPWPHCGSRLHG